jgi:predicted TPR repeat methyltransferase
LFFAADVLVYLGDVRPLFATCRSLARPTTSTGAPAVFAFSTEAWMGKSRVICVYRTS